MAVKINGKALTTHLNNSKFDDHLTPAAQVIKSGKGTTSVTKSYKGNVITEGHEEHVVASGLMIEAHKMASVACMGGRTINLGNFESARFEVQLTMPCAVDQIDKTYDFVMEWIGERIETATKGAKG